MEAIRIDSKSESTWKLLVDFYYLTDMPDKAIESVKHAFIEIGESSSLYSKMAAAYFDLNQRTEAFESLAKAINFNEIESDNFIEYYPESEDDKEIIDFIDSYKKQRAS
jgi:tetratricopeptide (TPR) repeat protein